MNEVISLREALRTRRSLTLVLIDLHEQADCDIGGNQNVIGALASCRAALSHARTIGMRVAFVRRVAETQLFGIHDKGPRWFPGFIPRRADMVFDRDRPSCYASAAFADVMKGRNMQYVVAGLFGDSACLATAVDAFHRDHRLTYLADASTSRAIGNLKDSEVHRVLEGIIGKYATVLRTRDWIGLNAYARSRQR